MPISDTDGYDNGHFTRVYEHLIKPAILQAGFNPIRADDKKNTNYIVIDILKMILDSDLVLCDLSSKNANVLYELGIRQAFNKKALLLKDLKTERIFDIQGLRHIEYDESLRIDSVKKDINLISEALSDTYKANDNEVNSLIQLLSIKPASISNSMELSNETSILLKAIESIDDRLNNLENKSSTSIPRSKNEVRKIKINNEEFESGDTIFLNSELKGRLIDILNSSIIVRDDQNRITKISLNHPNINTLSKYPF